MRSDPNAYERDWSLLFDTEAGQETLRIVDEFIKTLSSGDAFCWDDVLAYVIQRRGCADAWITLNSLDYWETRLAIRQSTGPEEWGQERRYEVL